MVDLSPPSINPTNYGSLTGVLNFALTKFLQGVDDMLPAQVVSFNRTTNMAQVQPLIPMVTTDNIILQRAAIQSVPVVQLGGGGFLLNFPLQSGDLGFIKANDRDISLFVQSWSSAIPNTARKHSFEDAVFIPSCLTGFTIAGADAANLVIQNLAGTVKISLSGNSVSITAPNIVNITAPQINLNASTDIALNTPTITQTYSGGGTATFNGSITATGVITGNTDVTTNTISLNGHKHSGVQPGSGNTGAAF